MNVSFFNVTIDIDASSPKAAYAKLCTLLDKPGVEYATDTYNFSKKRLHESETRSTEELWPKAGRP